MAHFRFGELPICLTDDIIMSNNHSACASSGLSASLHLMENDVAVPDPLADVRSRAPALGGSGIDYGVLPDLTGFSVKLTLVLAHGLIARELKDSGVTPLRFSVLEVVGRNPGLQQMQLAEALALPRPATTLALDFWEDRACLERRRLREDRRSFGIYATDTGIEALARMRTVIMKADAALTSQLTEAETRELRRLMQKIYL